MKINTIIVFLLFIDIIFTNSTPEVDNNVLSEIKSIYDDYGLNSDSLLSVHFIDQESDLQSIGKDIYGREQFLQSNAAHSWELMKNTAYNSNIYLFPVSGYRSYADQANIINRKLKRGATLEHILTVNKLPGYSEHHSGRAIDITNSKSIGLSDDFKFTNEYKWLIENADQFGFRLTYPEENNSGIIFEPWHWYYFK